MDNKLMVFSLEEKFELFEKADNICIKTWPEFMLHDPVATNNWMTFIEAYKKYQLVILDKEMIVAVINTIPLQYSGKIEELPDEGWDWGVTKAIDDLEKKREPNMLLGVQIVVNPDYQGKGISSFATNQMHNLIMKYNLEKLIIPVRPNKKSEYPLIDMNEYIKWKNEEGFVFDNWLRVHEKNGGIVIKVCKKAMKIEGTINEWTKWTGKKFPGSGDYIIEGALNPMSINLEQNLGIYIEPNVWVVYDNEKKMEFNAIRIKTKDFKFNRDEANY